MTAKPQFVRTLTMDTKNSEILLGEVADRQNLLDWTSVRWATNWADYTGSNVWGYPSYTKDGSGFVHLRGLGQYNSGTIPAANSVIFNLPVGFRPAHVILGLNTCSWGLYEWGMSTTGDFYWRSSKLGTHIIGNWFDFNGINWWSPPA